LFHWLNRWKANSNSRHSQGRARRPRRFRPRLETLEDRVTPSILGIDLGPLLPCVWTGAVSDNWSDTGNWLPQAPTYAIGDDGLPIEYDVTFDAVGVARPNVNVDDIVAAQIIGKINIGAPYTFSGLPLVAHGGLNDSPNSLLTSPTVFNDQISVAGPLTVAAGQTLQFRGGYGPFVVNGNALTLDGSLSKVGPGRLELSGASPNDFSVDVAEGTLALGSRDAAGPGVDDTSWSVDAGATLELSGNVEVSGHDLTITGSGTDGNGALVSTGGPNTWHGNVTVAGTQATIGVDAGATLRLDGVVQNNGSASELDKAGTGKLILAGANNCSGAMDVLAGTLAAEGNSALGSTLGGTVVGPLGTLELIDGDTITNEPLTLQAVPGFVGILHGDEGQEQWNGPVTLQGALGASPQIDVASRGELTLGGLVAGAAGVGLQKTGTGRVILGVANTYTGTTLVEAGDLTVRNSAALGTATAGTTVAIGATLELDGSLNIATEPLTLGASFLHAVNGSSTWSGPITLTDLSTVDVDSPDALTLSGGLLTESQHGVQKIGTGRLTLSAPTSATGGKFIISGGVLALTNQTALGAGSQTTVNAGAALEVDGNLNLGIQGLLLNGSGPDGSGALVDEGGVATLAGTVSIHTDTTIGVQAGGLLTVNAAIGGVAGLTLHTTGTVEFGGSQANTFAGTVAVDAGTLRLNKSAGTAVAGPLVVGDGSGSSVDTAMLLRPNQIDDGAPVTVNSMGLLDLTNSGAGDAVGAVTLQGGVITTGATVLTLGGTVSVLSASTPADITGNLSLGLAARTFSVQGGTTLRLEAVVTAGTTHAALDKTGAGTLEMTASSPYASPTIIDAGTLVLSGSLPNSDVVVNAGGALETRNSTANAGTVKSLTTHSRGRVSPGGLGSIGTLTVAGGDLTLDSGSILVIDIAGPRSGQFDAIRVTTGTVQVNGVSLGLFLRFRSLVDDRFVFLNGSGGPVIFSVTGGSPVLSDTGVAFAATVAAGDVVLIHINSPAAFQNRSITSPINEGQVAAVSGTITDPDPLDTFFLDVNWGDGSKPQTFTFLPGTPRAIQVTHRYLDDGSFNVHLSWRDRHQPGNSADLIATVLNVAPVVDAGADGRTDPGDVLNRTGSFSDPGADTWTATVDYGDGSGPQVLKITKDGQFHLHHKYAQPGTYTVTITVLDDDGGMGTASFQVFELA
jgi:autotransporter-associated beta strand protein